MSARASFAPIKIWWESIKCQPIVKISFDVENQDGCLETAKWEIESGTAKPCTKKSLVLSNKMIKSFSVFGGPENARFELKWDSSKKKLINAGVGEGRFVCEEMDSYHLDRYIDDFNSQKRSWHRNSFVTIELIHYPFFAEMIRYFTRNNKDFSNFASPLDPEPILNSIKSDRTTYQFKEFLSRVETIERIHALTEIKVTVPDGSPENREYAINIKLFEEKPSDYKALEGQRNETKTLLISSDYANLFNEHNNRRAFIKELIDKGAKPEVVEFFRGRKAAWYGMHMSTDDLGVAGSYDFGKIGTPLFPVNQFNIESETQTIMNSSKEHASIIKNIVSAEKSLSESEHNVHTYFTSRIPISRGVNFELDILQNAIKTPASLIALIDKIRDGIDAKLIPANIWDGVREDSNSESYQFVILKVLAWLSKENSFANPITYIRSAIYNDFPKLHAIRTGKMKLTLDEYSQVRAEIKQNEGWKIYLQLGVGNCGEHAQTSFHALTTLMKMGVKTNYQELLKNVILTGHRFADHGFVIGGFEIKEAKQSKDQRKFPYWNIADRLNQLPPGEDGFVIDPYMQNIRGMTARQFLKRTIEEFADTQEEVKQYKEAHFIEQYPAGYPKITFE